MPFFALLFSSFASANPNEEFHGTWVAWAPSSNSFEGEFRQVVNVGDQSSKIGRLFSITRDNKVIGAVIPESTCSEVTLTKADESGGYTAFKCVLEEHSYVMIFRADEMMLFDSTTKKMIHFFKRQDIKSPEFLQMLESTDGAADLIERFVREPADGEVKVIE